MTQQHGPCAHRGCVRTYHPQHPAAHVVYGAWRADRHDTTESRCTR